MKKFITIVFAAAMLAVSAFALTHDELEAKVKSGEWERLSIRVKRVDAVGLLCWGGVHGRLRSGDEFTGWLYLTGNPGDRVADGDNIICYAVRAAKNYVAGGQTLRAYEFRHGKTADKVAPTPTPKPFIGATGVANRQAVPDRKPWTPFSLGK